MKKDITTVRDRELLRLYRKILDDGCKNNREAARRIVSMPSPCFWIEPRTAMLFLSRKIRGESLEDIKGVRRRMYEELYRRYLEIRDRHPSLLSACRELVTEEAPEFYIGVDTAVKIIKRERDRTSCERH